MKRYHSFPRRPLALKPLHLRNNKMVRQICASEQVLRAAKPVIPNNLPLINADIVGETHFVQPCPLDADDCLEWAGLRDRDAATPTGLLQEADLKTAFVQRSAYSQDRATVNWAICVLQQIAESAVGGSLNNECIRRLTIYDRHAADRLAGERRNASSVPVQRKIRRPRKCLHRLARTIFNPTQHSNWIRIEIRRLICVDRS